MKISRDLNGNKIVKISGNDLKTWRNKNPRGFSIQTLVNLPLTDRNGVFYETKNEVFNYVNQFGTKKQKQLIGCNLDLTLNDFINGFTYRGVKLFKSLSIDDVDQLVDIIGGRNKDRIRSVLNYNLKRASFWGVETSFMYDHKLNRWSYCAGQDYPSEMSRVRKELLS
jgi:hypothetical protein